METVDLASVCSICGTRGRLLHAPAPEGLEVLCTRCWCRAIVWLRDVALLP